MTQQPPGKAERTRQFIIQQVAEVFNSRGYAATSMADLTSATGLSKGSIYGNFKNKDEVALAAFEYNSECIHQELRKAIEQAATPVEKLLAYPRTFRTIAPQVLARGGCPIANTAVDSSELNDLLQAAVCQQILTWKNALSQLIRQGVQERHLTATAEPESAAMVIISLLEGGYIMARATGDYHFVSHAIDEMERLIRRLTVQGKMEKATINSARRDKEKP